MTSLMMLRQANQFLTPTPEREITIGVGTKAATIWRAAARLQLLLLGEISRDAAPGGSSPPDSSETLKGKLAEV